MSQRDLQSQVRVDFLGSITLTGTGDVDGTVSVDTKDARAVAFVVKPATDFDSGDVIACQAKDSPDDSTFTEVPAAQMLPGQAAVAIDVTKTAAGKPSQVYGVFGTDRYVRPRFNITTLSVDVVVDVYAIVEEQRKPADDPATDALP